MRRSAVSVHLEVSSAENLREQVLRLLRELPKNAPLCTRIIRGLVLFRSQGGPIIIDRENHREKSGRPRELTGKYRPDDRLEACSGRFGPNQLHQASWCVIIAAAAHSAAYVASLENPPPAAEHPNTFEWLWCHHFVDHDQQVLMGKVQEARVGEWRSNMVEFAAPEVDIWLSEYFCRPVNFRKNRLWSGEEQVPCEVRRTEDVCDGDH